MPLFSPPPTSPETAGRHRFSVVLLCFLWRRCESRGLNLASVVWLINSRCLTPFFWLFFFKEEEDKTAVHCSADVLVSLSKYVAQGGRGQATNKNYRSFPKVIWICHHLARQGQQSDFMVYKVKYKLVANVSSDAALTRVSADLCCLKQMHETLRLHHFPGS